MLQIPTREQSTASTTSAMGGRRHDRAGSRRDVPCTDGSSPGEPGPEDGPSAVPIGPPVPEPWRNSLYSRGGRGPIARMPGGRDLTGPATGHRARSHGRWQKDAREGTEGHGPLPRGPARAGHRSARRRRDDRVRRAHRQGRGPRRGGVRPGGDRLRPGALRRPRRRHLRPHPGGGARRGDARARRRRPRDPVRGLRAPPAARRDAASGARRRDREGRPALDRPDPPHDGHPARTEIQPGPRRDPRRRDHRLPTAIGVPEAVPADGPRRGLAAARVEPRAVPPRPLRGHLRRVPRPEARGVLEARVAAAPRSEHGGGSTPCASSRCNEDTRSRSRRPRPTACCAWSSSRAPPTAARRYGTLRSSAIPG